MLIEQHQFRGLVDQHQSMVYSIALRVAGDRGAAEEIAQDAFLELHTVLASMQSADHVKFWLRRVTVHRAMDYLRRRVKRPEWKAEEWDDASDARNLQDRLSSVALEVRLDHMVSSLPAVLRSALVMRYQEDLDPIEIASLLGQPLATVKSNLQRALGLLRRKSEVMLKEFKRERV